MKRILLLFLIFAAIVSAQDFQAPVTTSGLQIGAGPVAIPKSGLPSWLNSDWSPVFNGVNQYAQADVPTLPIGSAPRSIMFWFKNEESLSVTDKSFFLYGNVDIDTACMLTLSNGKIQLNFGGNYYAPGAENANIGAWKHYVFVYPGGVATNSKIFIDGVQKSYTAYSGSQQIPNTSNNTTLYFGGRYASWIPAVYMAELSIWNRALSQSEILKYKDKRLKGTENGLVALYHMNEGPGVASQTLVDSVGGKNATCYNSVQWTRRNGYQAPDIRAASMALSFDGVDDYALATATNLPATASARTMMGWFFDTTPATEDTVFIYGGTYGNGKAFGITMGLSGINTIGLSTTGYHMYQPYIRQAGSWNHFAITLPTEGTMGSATIWVNGNQLTTTKSYIGGNANTALDTGTGFLSIGNYGGTYFGPIWFAKIKPVELSIWNRALSQSEIQQYMYQSLTGSETGLVRYYKINEGTGTTIKDYTSGHYDATAYNSPIWVGRDIP